MGTGWRAEPTQSLEPFPPIPTCLCSASSAKQTQSYSGAWALLAGETLVEGGLWENLRRRRIPGSWWVTDENPTTMGGNLGKIPVQRNPYTEH